jgi:hypothetical protein
VYTLCIICVPCIEIAALAGAAKERDFVVGQGRHITCFVFCSNRSGGGDSALVSINQLIGADSADGAPLLCLLFLLAAPSAFRGERKK